MNIIYMHSHDTGRYIQPYGYAVPTPNLMDFAREGILFRSAFCAGPTCSPSRSALLTGMWAHSSGMIGLAHRGFRLSNYDRHLVRYLKKSGFETALAGVQHEAASSEEIGYDHVLANEIVVPEAYADSRDEANAFRASQYLKEKKSKPFFLSVGFWNTHRPFPVPDPDINPDYLMPPSPFYDSKENREDMAGYLTSARILDRCVGMVLDALKESGIADETIILYTTDHGIAFPKMKCNLYDTGIGVSLILKYPGQRLGGSAVQSLVSHVDLFPTLCDLAGVAKPDWLQGTSLLPILSGEAERVRDHLFSEVTYHAAYEPQRCIRSERYKLIRRYDRHDNHVPANIDDGFSKSFLLEHGFLEEQREKELLFDLYLDPVERVNVRHDDRYRDIYRDLTERLDRWMEETGDPLLTGEGYVEKPEGAVVNKLSCISPQMEDFE